MSSDFKLEWIGRYTEGKDLVIFDIGACSFQDSNRFADAYPDSKVYAFEVDPEVFATYKELVRSNVVPINVAVGNYDGVGTFYPSTTNEGTRWIFSGSLMTPKIRRGTEDECVTHKDLHFNMKGIDVEVRTFEFLCRNLGLEKVDVVHMDVQGAEYKVVQRMGKYKPKILFLEISEYETYDCESTQEELEDLLTSIGYKLFERLEYDTLYVLQ